MTSDPVRDELATADVLRWQTVYRLAVGLGVGGGAVALHTLRFLDLSAVAARGLGVNTADWLLGLIPSAYLLLVLGIRRRLTRRHSAGRALSTVMVVADMGLIFSLMFLLTEPTSYDLGLFIALVSLQLTHVYFGRDPALVMLTVIGAGYLLLQAVAQALGGDVFWEHVLLQVAVFSLGGLLLTGVQANLHARLARLVTLLEGAREGNFSSSYNVAADTAPDIITSVGRAYNRMRAQLATIVLTDPLTGCANRRGFELQYRRELSRAARTGTELALIALDLDHFKTVNDSHGHLVGDRVLAEAGALLRSLARAEDLVARTGGEEFLLIAPNTSAEGARLLALRITDAFRAQTFGEPRAKVSLTMSAGLVADRVPNDSIAESLRARADEALYTAKRRGRNQVVVWHPPSD